MPGQLDGKRIPILATNGFEQAKLEAARNKGRLHKRWIASLRSQ
jgi:hypothetical protein